jgi:hypothetical protein
MQGERLNPDEDQALRRLHWFEALGCELSSALRNLKDNFRSRDRRTEIREPGQAFDKGKQMAQSDASRGKKPDAPSYWTR